MNATIDAQNEVPASNAVQLLPDLRDVVVAVDFTPVTTALVEAAAMLIGQREDVRVQLLFVSPTNFYNLGDFGVIPAPQPDDTKSAEQIQLQSLRKRLTAKTHVDLLVREGFPATEICAVALEHRADLILVSSHSRTGMKRFLMGSTTEEVVHDAPCSVMVVKPARTRVRMGNPGSLHRIGVAFDGSESSRAALAAALRLAKQSGSQLHLLRAVAPLSFIAGDVLVSTDEMRQKVAQMEMDSVCREIHGDLVVANHVEAGKPWRVLSDLASKHSCDLLIIGAHEHWHPGESVLGTTAERVLRYADCSVLMVRPSRSS